MIQDQVDEAYFEWLYDQAHRERGENSPLTYTIVSGLMHGIIFNDSVPNDDNRSADGRELRDRFLEENKETFKRFGPDEWNFYSSPCTFFEMLVALCYRCDFQVELGVSNWFYIFIQNLNLKQYADNDYAVKDKGKITRVLNIVNNRTYRPSGSGGLFPLREPKQDQRKIELWYQMSAYVIENDLT